jgi:hypothetical protein
VEEYAKKITHLHPQPEVISPLPRKRVQEYVCPLFSVSDEGWYSGNREPFHVSESFLYV